MAKTKTFAVLVEVVEQHMIFVDARRPGGAIEKVQTEEGWTEATRYNEDVPRLFNSKNMRVVKVMPVP